MNPYLLDIISLFLSIIILIGGITLFKYRVNISARVVEIRKVRNSFLLRTGNIAGITIIAVSLVMIGLMLTMAYILLMLAV